jgi:hypothetical protein
MAMELFALACIELVLHLRNASLNGQTHPSRSDFLV